MNTLPNNSTRSIVNQSIEKKFKKIEEELSAIRTDVASNATSITNHTNELSADSILIEENANDITELGVTVASLQSEIDSKQDIIEVTSDVTPNSSALVTSGGVANKLEEYYKKSDVVTTDLGRHGVSNDNRPCSAGVVYDVYADLHEQIEGKVNKSDVVDSVTLGNLNPVTSNAVKVETQKNADEITKIKNGTEIVGKANADKDGNEITSTYATKTALQTEINNRVTQHNEINEHLERLDESIEGFIPSEEKGIANGVATLDAEGRLPYSQLPESAMEFKGLWSASTNTPHLEDGVGTNGDFYLCTEGGEVDFGSGSITFELNDRVIYEGNTDKWYRLNGSALTSVTSVNGKSGAVTLNYNDVNALPNTTTHLSGDVPTTRKVNGKTLESDITLSASDVGALSSDTTIPTKLSELTDDSTHRLVTDSEKTSWGAKYSKPSSGIPKTDLSSDVQTSLGKADTSIQTETKLSLGTTTGSGNAITDLSVNNHTITLTKGKSFVEQVSGKGLSTNDFTTTLKNKLDGIASGAEVNVQSDWNVTDTSSDAYIKNKPTIPSAVTESTVSGWGFTKNTGTVTGVKINGSTKSPTNGIVDLGTVSGEKLYTYIVKDDNSFMYFISKGTKGVSSGGNDFTSVFIEAGDYYVQDSASYNVNFCKSITGVSCSDAFINVNNNLTFTNLKSVSNICCYLSEESFNTQVFYKCENIHDVKIGSEDNISVEDFFIECENINNIEIDFTGITTQGINGFFTECTNISNVILKKEGAEEQDTLMFISYCKNISNVYCDVHQSNYMRLLLSCEYMSNIICNIEQYNDNYIEGVCFDTCKKITNCNVTHKDTSTSSFYPFKDCRGVLNCRVDGSFTNRYVNSYSVSSSTSSTYACGATPNGGFNTFE